MKVVEKDGHSYRWRRGVLVLIPDKWVNKIPNASTINKRDSKENQGSSYVGTPFRKAKQAKKNKNVRRNKKAQ